jgi:hypothetical protein
MRDGQERGRLDLQAGGECRVRSLGRQEVAELHGGAGGEHRPKLRDGRRGAAALQIRQHRLVQLRIANHHHRLGVVHHLAAAERVVAVAVDDGRDRRLADLLLNDLAEVLAFLAEIAGVVDDQALRRLDHDAVDDGVAADHPDAVAELLHRRLSEPDLAGRLQSLVPDETAVGCGDQVCLAAHVARGVDAMGRAARKLHPSAA